MNESDKIMQMKAGVGLDILIAYTVVHTEIKTGKQIGFNAEGYEDSTFWNIGGRWDVTPPPFSTDIAAAWIVVEALIPSFRFALAQIDSGRFWFAQFENIEHFGEWEAFEAEAESAPLAICRAALLAVQP